VRARISAMTPEAVDVDWRQTAQFMDELIDMNTGPAVDLWWPFAGENSDAHSMSIGNDSHPL